MNYYHLYCCDEEVLLKTDYEMTDIIFKDILKNRYPYFDNDTFLKKGLKNREEMEEEYYYLIFEHSSYEKITQKEYQKAINENEVET